MPNRLRSSKLLLVSAAIAALVFTLSPGLPPQTHRRFFVSNFAMPASAAPAKPRPLAVLWDIDGTLVESTRLAFEGTNEVLKSSGHLEITEAQYKEGCKYTTPRRFAYHVSGDPDDPVGPGLGAQFDELYVQKVSPTTVPLFEGLRDLLGELKRENCRFSAVSNACTAYVRAVIATHGLESDFQCQLGPDDLPAAKPAPDGLLHVCSLLGLNPADCAYVGDAPTDGQAAQAAGMRGIGVTWGSYSRERVAEHFDDVVDSVPALRAALMGDAS
eukprot:gb/GFBE01014958.1/.p1 GENE.gb/GFBE01014958.1/~~gb/GFBE01014958.1/.p1  ORF type:complete len:272 (+),score=42.06 gb/GFBE01014958.1/:1-816(+)